MSQAQTTEPVPVLLLTAPPSGKPYWMSHPDRHTPAHRLIGYDVFQPVVCDAAHPWRPHNPGVAVTKALAEELEAFWCRKCCPAEGAPKATVAIR